MKPETMQKIMVLLKKDMECKRSDLMRVIENTTGNNGVEECVREYRMAYNAYSDFEIWMDDNEED